MTWASSERRRRSRGRSEVVAEVVAEVVIVDQSRGDENRTCRIPTRDLNEWILAAQCGVFTTARLNILWDEI